MGIPCGRAYLLQINHSDLNFPVCVVDKGHFLAEVGATNALMVNRM